MAVRFTMLASGSGGNAALLEADGFGLLLDAGLGPRLMASRLAAVGATWRHVGAVLLTHTHSDHWKDRNFAQFQKLGIPVYCHDGHHPVLEHYSPAFIALRAAGLVKPYEAAQDFTVGPGLVCRPLAVDHDSGPTFGFRIAGSPGLFGPTWAIGYLADLGRWSPQLAEELLDLDVLALEFNHDERMERNSGRPRMLVERVLSDYGHLSNHQAAQLLREVLARSNGATALRHVVQLHLSRDCNCPKLAAQTARAVLAECGVAAQVHTAAQNHPGPVISVKV